MMAEMRISNLPHAPEAELACLGVALTNTSGASMLFEKLREADFYDARNQHIFRVLSSLAEQSVAMDAVTVVSTLRGDGEGAAPVIDHIHTVVNSVFSVASMEHYLNIVRDKAILRELVEAARHVIVDIQDNQDADIDEVIDRVERSIFEITGRRTSRQFTTMREAVPDTLRHLERIEQVGMTMGIPTYYHALDELTTGFGRGDLVILAARPAMGKTALALSTVMNLLRHTEDRSVLFFSLEMSVQELVMRLLASESRIFLQKLRSGKLDQQRDWNALIHAAANLQKTRMVIDDTPSIHINELRSKARRVKSRYGCDLVVVDHIQLISASSGQNSIANRTNEISFISRSLKALAKELDVPVMVLSQLSRGVEARTDKRPQLSDLRESGAIEQDADLVMMLYRDEYYYKEQSSEPNVAELIIQKQRNGPVGTVKLYFDAKLARFESLDERG